MYIIQTVQVRFAIYCPVSVAHFLPITMLIYFLRMFNICEQRPNSTVYTASLLCAYVCLGVLIVLFVKLFRLSMAVKITFIIV